MKKLIVSLFIFIIPLYVFAEVVYFPNKTDENNYMVGYVHRDQIKVIDKFNF